MIAHGFCSPIAPAAGCSTCRFPVLTSDGSSAMVHNSRFANWPTHFIGFIFLIDESQIV
jgi:hypothetical protein